MSIDINNSQWIERSYWGIRGLIVPIHLELNMQYD